METSGVMGNRLLLGLSKVTATKQLKTDHSLSQSHQAQNAAEHSEVKQEGLGQERKQEK